MRLLLFAVLFAPALARAQEPAPEAGAEASSGPTAEAPSAEAPDADELLLPELAETSGAELSAPSPGGEGLARPAVDPHRVARLLAGIEARRAALAHDRGGADLEMAVAVNLYVGGGLLALLTTSLLVGVAFEGVCINGVIDECTDGASFLIGAVPAAIGALALFVGAYTTEVRAAERHRILDARERDTDDAERTVPGRLVSLGPAGLTASF